VFLDNYGEYININEHGSVLDAQMLNAPTTPYNIDVIFLCREESLLFNGSKQLNFERQSQRKIFKT
jgi:hypothetical protein